MCQKQYKRRNTLQNKDKLKEAEVQLEEAKLKAEEEWANKLVDSFENAATPKESWDVYRKMTENSVLPLIHKDGIPIFDAKEKCQVLQEVFFEGAHLKDNNFDQNFFDEITHRCQGIAREIDLTNDQDSFNADFLYEELEAAIQITKAGKAPGPDSFYPEFFINAGENLKSAILYIFNMSWSAGVVPDEWKAASVKFLRKQGKTDYYSLSS